MPDEMINTHSSNGFISPITESSTESPSISFIEKKTNDQSFRISSQSSTESPPKPLSASDSPPQIAKKTDTVASAHFRSDEEIDALQLADFSLAEIQQGNTEDAFAAAVFIADGIIRNNGKDPETLQKFLKFGDEIVQLTKEHPNAKEISNTIKIAKQITSFEELNTLTSFAEALEEINSAFEISAEDVEKEASVLSLKNGEPNVMLANLTMVKRILLMKSAGRDAGVTKGSISIKAQQTGFDASVVQTCEKMFSRLVQQKNLEAAQPQEHKGYVIIPGFVNNKPVILVEHKVLGSGGFKDTMSVADYLSLNSHYTNSKLVTKRIQNPSLPPPSVRSESEISVSTKLKEMGFDYSVRAHAGAVAKRAVPPARPHTSGGSAVGGSFVINEESITNSGSIVINDSVSDLEKEKPKNRKPETAFYTARSDQFYSLDALHQLETREVRAPLAKDGQAPRILDRRIANIDKTREYEKEVQIQKALQGPGIEPIYTVVETVTGRQVIVCPEAGYEITSPNVNVEKKHVVDLFGHLDALPLNRQSPEDRLQVLGMLRDTLTGLNHMHEVGYVHKDIKPQNTLINPDGKVVLTDFGLTRHQNDPHVSDIEGTPIYMAPEVCANYSVTTKSDIWSYGMMVYNMTHESISGSGNDWHKGFNAIIPEPSFTPNILVVQEMRGLIIDADKKQLYDDAFPEPTNKNSVDYLVWVCTRVNPDERPTAQELMTLLDNIIAEEQTKIA